MKVTLFQQLANEWRKTSFSAFSSSFLQMSFSISTKSMHRGSSHSHNTLHQATSKDYDRLKLAAKHEAKHEQDFEHLERKMISRAKWIQRAENNQIRLPTNPSSSDRLDDFLERQRLKQENMIKAKQLGNERIRRSSITNSIPK